MCLNWVLGRYRCENYRNQRKHENKQKRNQFKSINHVYLINNFKANAKMKMRKEKKITM